MTSNVSRIALLLAVACSSAPESSTPLVSDSAGVTLVEYPASVSAASERSWTTDSAPILAIGEPAPELHRIQTALYLSDGRIVVANGVSQELLIFDSAGQLLARAGGHGEGPGELLRLTWLTVGPADSLFVYDGPRRGITVFDHNGAYARSVRLTAIDTLGFTEYVGVLEDGSIVGAFRRRTPGPGLVRDSLAVTFFAPTGEPPRLLAVFPDMYEHWGLHTLPGQEPAAFPVPVPFSPLTGVAVGRTSVYVGVPEPYALLLLDASGVRRITRQDAPSPALTDAHRDRLLTVLHTGPLSPRELDILFALDGPTRLPAFGLEPTTANTGEPALLVTASGGVWLRPFQIPDERAPSSWPRFDANGLYEGVAIMPLGFRPTTVRDGVVLGVYTDDIDVESVRAYRLRAGDGSPVLR